MAGRTVATEAGPRPGTASTEVGPRLLPGGGCAFEVWAPRASSVEVRILGPRPRAVAMERGPDGYHRAVVDGAGPGTPYLYSLDGREGRPDPASRLQPEGVHGPSEVVDPAFPWTDAAWRGRALEDLVFYEAHVGTFTAEGTFDGARRRLDDLVSLGVTALELMPVAAFPGSRNWGYDGAFPWAVQASYGGPQGLRRLVDACHARGLAVVLDVVYNHLGPEGNCLAEFGPYFTDRHRTPWGPALNFDGPGSDEVRRYFLGNALAWFETCHVDALRLDAVHGIFDVTARPFLAELADEVAALATRLDRRLHLVAESNLNDPRLVRPRGRGGLGLDAAWSDDFHHALHVALTGDRSGYYEDFAGAADLSRAFSGGFVFTGQRSAYRGRRHGAPASDLPGSAFVICSQNHDQVGNRMRGDRLASLVDGPSLGLAAAAVVLSPFLPLLFMGEEHGETAPFPYFVSHADPALVAAVREGRRREFAAFGWEGEPPDPQAEETFRGARPDWGLAARGPNARLRALYAELLRLRRERPALRALDLGAVSARAEGDLVWVRRAGRPSALLALHFGHGPLSAALPSPGRWRLLLDTADERWGGPGSLLPERLAGPARLAPRSAALFEEEP